MTIKFNFLASPIVVNGKEIKNRVVVPPMADFGMTKPDGLINDRHIQHYKSFALGGAGLIIVEACAVSENEETRNTLTLKYDTCIPGLSKLSEVLIANGAVTLVQLYHPGIPFMSELTLSEISRKDFLRYKADFISAAIRCRKAGFNGIELHAAHGFYLNQIMENSTRTDEYGGSFENRIRIVEELIAGIKDTCGKDFIVAVRFGNPNIKELLQTAQAIENAGGDILDVSTGCFKYGDIPMDFPFDEKIYAASLVKKAVNIPVICVGNITSGEQADQILELELADMVAVGRGHLCDPQWVEKAINAERPNPCLNCRTCLWYMDGRKCPALN